MIFDIEAEIARQRRENVQAGEQRLVIIGDGRGGGIENLYVNPPTQPDDPPSQYLWVRDIGGKGDDIYNAPGLPYPVLPGVGPSPEIDKQVWIEWQSGPRAWQIKLSDPDHMAQTHRSMHMENPSDPHNQFDRTESLLPLLSLPLPGGKVNVQGYQYVYKGEYYDYKGTSDVAGTHPDLLSLAPTTLAYHCYALLAYNYALFAAASNPIEVFTSTPKAWTVDLNQADIDECLAQMSAESIEIKVYRLAADMDTGWRGSVWDRDLRPWINTPLWIPDSFITTAMIANEAVTTPKLSPFALRVTTAAPTVNDDSADGYAVRSLWFDSAAGILYVATSVAVGAAVWVPVAGTGAAPATAHYLTTQAESGLTNEFNLGALASGMLKQSVAAGVSTPSIAVANTDYVPPTGAILIAPTIADFTNAQHPHTTAASGGQLTDAALSDPVGVAKGGSGADMSGTGGANFLLKQTGVGAAFTAALMVLADIPNLLITGAKIALATIGLTNLANGTPFRYMGWDSTGAAAELDGALDVTGDTGESWAIRDALYLNTTSNTWFKIDTDAVPPKIGAIRGVALAAATHPASGQRIRREGIVGGYSGLTPGAPLYASTTAGGYTQTKPSVSMGDGQIVVCEIGYAISAATAFIDKDAPIEYLNRDWVASGGTLEIVHHSDPEGRTRETSAYLASNIEVISEQCVTSDTDVPLKRRATGSTVVIDAAGVTNAVLGDTAGTDIRLAQQFEVTTTGYVSTITFSTGATTGAPSAFPSYRIEGNNAFLTIPNGTPITNSSSTLTSWTASGTVTITYVSPGPYLVAGGKYWFILELPMQASNNRYTVIRNTAGAYAAGVLKWDSTTGASWPDTWANGGGTEELRMSITTVVMNDQIGQGLTLPSTIDITRVELYLKRTGALAGDILTVELWLGTGSGQPLTAIYTSDNVLASSVGTSAGYVSFPFNPPARSNLGTEWFVVLTSSGIGSATEYIDWAVDTTSPPFSGGVFIIRPLTTWADYSPAADGRFILYAVDTYFDVPIAVGYGSTAMEAHYGDTSYADQDTTTTFENIDGAGMDATVKVRMG